MNPFLVPLVLEAALRAMLAAFAVWAVLRLLRVRNVLVQKAAWDLVLVAALAMPFLPLMPRLAWLPTSAALRLPALPWQTAAASSPAAALPTAPHTEASAAPQAAALPADSLAADRSAKPAISGADPSAQAEPDPIPGKVAAAPQADSPQGSLRLVRLAAFGWIVYLGVAAVLLLRLLCGLGSALSLWIAANPVRPALDLAAGMALRSSPRVASPVTIGSAALLPADYTEWDAQKLRIVLAHERSHIRQGDFYLQILAGLYASVFWFSPLGWWLKRKLCELGEAISDRAGLEEAATSSSYAQLLLEFAALPRPTLIGVAMARTSHLSHRIEYLLNETSFRQAFAAGGRRARLAVLLVPAALFAAAAFIHVEAAVSSAPAAQAPITGQSTPEPVTNQAPPAAPADSPAIPAPPAPGAEPAPAPMPPMPAMPAREAEPPAPPMPPAPHGKDAYRGYAYSYTNDGQAYAIVGDPGAHIRFSGDWDGDRKADIEKARKMAHGHFLWFRHDGKSYIVDDSAIVARIEAMNNPLEALGSQMRALGEQQRSIGEQQKELGKQMRQASIPTPDLTKEMAELNAAVAALQVKQGGTVSPKDLADLQRKLGQLQGKLGALEGRIGAQQGNLGGEMGKLGGKQGKLGGEMGTLGAQMGRLAKENEGAIKGIIADSLRNGKARPVE